MSATLLVALAFLNLVVSTMGWSCLLQRDAVPLYQEGYKGAKPCEEEDAQDLQPHKREVAVLSRSVLVRNHPAPAPAAHAAPAAPAAPGASAVAAAGGHAASPNKKEIYNDKKDIAAALRTELRIPVTIREIHDSPQGPLSRFLQTVHNEFCKSLNVESKRVSILGIRGEYTKLESMLLDEKVVEDPTGKNLHVGFVDAAADSNPHEAAHGDAHGAATAKAEKESEPKKDTASDHEVIVDLEILPGAKASDPSPDNLFQTLKGLIATKGSSLLAGPLAAQLQGSVLSLGAKPTGDDVEDTTARSKGAVARWCVPIALLMWAHAVVM